MNKLIGLASIVAVFGLVFIFHTIVYGADIALKFVISWVSNFILFCFLLILGYFAVLGVDSFLTPSQEQKPKQGRWAHE